MTNEEYRQAIGELTAAAGFTGALLVHLNGRADPMWLRAARQLHYELMMHVTAEEHRVARALYASGNHDAQISVTPT